MRLRAISGCKQHLCPHGGNGLIPLVSAPKIRAKLVSHMKCKNAQWHRNIGLQVGRNRSTAGPMTRGPVC